MTSNKISELVEYGKFKSQANYEVKLNRKILKSFSTKGYLFLQTGKTIYSIFSLTSGDFVERVVNEQAVVILFIKKEVYEFFHSDKVIIRTKSRLLVIDLNKNEIKEVSLSASQAESNGLLVSQLSSRKYQSLLFFRGSQNGIILEEFELSLNKFESSIQISTHESCQPQKVFSGFLDENFKAYSLINCENGNIILLDVISKTVVWQKDEGLNNIVFSQIVNYNVDVDQSVDYTTSHFHKLEGISFVTKNLPMVLN